MPMQQFAMFQRGTHFTDGWWRDLVLACRSLRATPVLTLVAIASLTLPSCAIQASISSRGRIHSPLRMLAWPCTVCPSRGRT